MTRILIVDDQELFRDSLSIIMKSSDEIEVTGAVASVDEALASINETMPDAVLMDIRMPGKDGVEGTRLIKNRYPNVKVIVLTTFDDDEYVYGALKYGASGYLLKGCSSGTDGGDPSCLKRRSDDQSGNCDQGHPPVF